MTAPDYDAVRDAARELTARLGGRVPRLAIVLGSGLGGLADADPGAVRIPYAELPLFWRPTVTGHAGELACARVAGAQVLVLSGRNHLYEGLTAAEVGTPVRVLAAAGVTALVLTNSAGGVNPGFAAGDLMVIEDHLNLSGDNPLRGPNDSRLGPRFPDMTEVYDRGLRDALARAAAREDIPLHGGVYACLSGPSYETPAEVRMLRTLGADAVGMSTVPEAIVARHCGVRVAGISCITNPAAGLTGSTLSHTDVVETAALAGGRIRALLAGLCGEFADEDRPDTPR